MVCCVIITRVRLLVLTTSLGISTILSPSLAEAEIEKITITSAEDLGPFAGKLYREVEARMYGTAPGGPYEVPLTLAFPTAAADFDGFTVVDLPTTSTMLREGFVLGGGVRPVARNIMGDAFLFGRGTGYVSVVWDNIALEKLGDGAIAARTDGFTVLRDAATLARNPSRYLPAESGIEAPEQARTIAHGYSQTGSLLRGWFFDGHNSEGDTRAFDGGIVGAAGAWCHDLVAEDGKACTGAISDGARVISLLPEGDVAWGGFDERADSPEYRVIEIAGVAHIPSTMADFRKHGLPEQNPVSFAPVARAALVNLEEWLDGREPPPSIALEVTDEAPATFWGAPFFALARDKEGNAIGGLRLPHMPSRLADGTRAGAPLGTYTSIALDREAENIFFALAGKLAPYPPDKLQALYPDQDAYVAAVAAAANDLAARRYILPEDAAAYIDAAKTANIGQH